MKKNSGKTGQPDNHNVVHNDGINNFDKRSNSIEPEYNMNWKKIKGALNSDNIINQMKSQLLKFNIREKTSAKNANNDL